MDLVNAFPKLHMQVQDSSASIWNKDNEILHKELYERVITQKRELFLTRSILEHTESANDGGTGPLVFLMRRVMWCYDNDKCINLLSSFIPGLEIPSRPTLVFSDLVSPARGSFERGESIPETGCDAHGDAQHQAANMKRTDGTIEGSKSMFQG